MRKTNWISCIRGNHNTEQKNVKTCNLTTRTYLSLFNVQRDDNDVPLRFTLYEPMLSYTVVYIINCQIIIWRSRRSSKKKNAFEIQKNMPHLCISLMLIFEGKEKGLYHRINSNTHVYLQLLWLDNLLLVKLTLHCRLFSNNVQL